MPNRGTQQDRPKQRRPDPTTTMPDDDEAQQGDVTRMEEAGNKPKRAQSADADMDDESKFDSADSDESDLDDDDEEGDSEPIGGRV